MPPSQKETLEQISYLEDLNRALNVVTIKGWIVLVFFALLSVATVFWAVWGTLPVTASGKCIILVKESKILGFLPLFSGQQIKPGMAARAALDTVNSSRYGMIEGVVKKVFPYPISAHDALLEQIPSEPLRDYLVSGEVPTILIVIEPYPDSKTDSGFKWTSKKGPPTAVPSGSVGQVQITLETVKPISYVIPFS